MRRRLPLFYSALLLTAVNLMLRMAGTSFQVYLSRRIGAAGIGLLQLTMSVGGLAMVAGIGGIRTATMYLTAEELGSGRTGTTAHVLSGCFVYSILCSCTVGAGLYALAPRIAAQWIGDSQVVDSLRLLACFLPVSCLCGVMTGYFTAENRIDALAAVEILEQVCTMAVTLMILSVWAGSDPGKACQSVVLGSALGACLTLVLLILLWVREKNPVSAPIAIRRRLLRTAVPLAVADVIKSGINTTENLMVPRRLALAVTDPLAAFGMVTGMVFPVLMFPACILFGLAELLIPEIARCAAAGSRNRIAYLMRRSLRVALLYGVFFSGLLFLLADKLCMGLYNSAAAGAFLRWYAPLAPMLYCDAITDAMIKGLGQQTASVRINIFTSALDVLFLFFLLPVYGMKGYFFSFLLTHLINFLLSIRRLLMICPEQLSIRLPLLTLICGAGAVWLVRHFTNPLLAALAFPPTFLSGLYLLRVISGEDLRWVRQLLQRRK